MEKHDKKHILGFIKGGALHLIKSIQGERGNGVKRITVEESNVNDGNNVVTFIEDNNIQTVFNVKNGTGIENITEPNEHSFEDGDLNIYHVNYSNGNHGEIVVGNGHTGQQGPQGATAVYDEQNPPVKVATIETTPGQSQTDTMTQKAITDEIYGQMEYEEDLTLSNINGSLVESDTIASSSSQKVWYAAVAKDDIINVIVEGEGYVRTAFLNKVPAVGDTVIYRVEKNITTDGRMNTLITSPVDGYVIVSGSESYLTTITAKARKTIAKTEQKVSDVAQSVNDVNTNINKFVYSISDLLVEDNELLPTRDEDNDPWAGSLNPETGNRVQPPTGSALRIYPYNVESGTILKIKGRASNNTAGYCFRDANKSLYIGKINNTNTAVLFEDVVVVPAGATTLWVGCNTSNPASVYTLKKAESEEQKAKVISNLGMRHIVEEVEQSTSKISTNINNMAASLSALFATGETLVNTRDETNPLKGYISPTTGGRVAPQSSVSALRIYVYQVEPGMLVSIKGRAVAGSAGYSFRNAGGCVYIGEINDTQYAKLFETTSVVPEGSTILYVGCNTDNPAVVKTLVKAETETQKAEVRANLGIKSATIKTIYPKMQWGYLKNADGSYHYEADTTINRQALSTMRFIKVSGNVKVKVPFDSIITVHRYGSDFSHQGYEVFSDIPGNTDQDIETNGASYIKLVILKPLPEGGTRPSIPITRVAVTGVFDSDWDYYNISNNGRTIVPVWVQITDPTCCDDESDSVQDAGQILPDYGRIYLPPTYTNTGTPTRLIIYCHGAAVNYSNSNIDSDERVDLDPEYWLAEGCAVLDVEGNPFDNSNEHSYMPQAMDCYVAAYKWAVEYYNLRRDGVFLGGRSMGGGTCIMLTRDECPIPVIAVCPNAAATMMPISSNADRKTFYAEHCGFELPDGFTFGDGWLEAEKQVWLDNWDRWVSNMAAFVWVDDLPTSDGEKSAFIEQMWGGDVDRLNLLKSLHGHCKCPVKFFACRQDSTVGAEGSLAMYRMLMNSGQKAEMRIFNSTKNYSGTGTTAHHYDTQDEALRADVTTKYGEELTDIPVVYIEMLRFWRRYEQEI